jgi:hypothetical protein
MRKFLVVKEEYMGQILQVVIPGMGKVKIDTDKIGSDKSFYINSGLGYLFEEITISETIIDEVIEDIKEEEKVVEVEDKVVKKKGGRPRKKV